MCGRFTLKDTPRHVARMFGADLAHDVEGDWEPSYNIPPTHRILGVTHAQDNPGRIVDQYRWGLVPSWAKSIDVGVKAFNARADTVAEKPTFRSAFRAQRVVVPANSFFEWRRATDKQAFGIARRDGDFMGFAGIWDSWTHPEGATIRSSAIITCEANADMSPIHSRMPVVLERDAWDLWLNPLLSDRGELESIISVPPPGILKYWPVGRAVGSVANDGPELLETEPPGTLFDIE